MEPLALGLAAVGLLAAGIIKGATGLGYASCALPFLVWSVGLEAAMSLVLVPAIMTNVFVALTAGHFVELASRFWPMYLAILPGIATGLSILLLVDKSFAVAALGIILVLYAAFALSSPELRLPLAWERWLKFPAGLINGIVTGATGSQVMPMIPFVMALDLDPARTVQAVNIGVLLSSLALAVGLALSGLLTVDLALMSTAAIILALVGTWLGNLLRAWIPPARFRQVMLAVLALMGVAMVLRA